MPEHWLELHIFLFFVRYFAGAAAPQAAPFDEHTALAELLSDLDHVPSPEEAKCVLLSSEPRRKIPVIASGAHVVRPFH